MSSSSATSASTRPNDPVTPFKSNKRLLVQDTPIAKNENSSGQYGFDEKDAKARNKRYAHEAKKFFLGPMPVDEFLDHFLPRCDVRKMPPAQKAFDKIPSTPGKEPEIYDPLIAAINRPSVKTGSRCPGFEFVNTSTRSESQREKGAMRPDVCCYRTEHAELSKASTGKNQAHLGYAQLFIEVKLPHLDFFADPPPDMSAADRENHKFFYKSTSERTQEKITNALGQNVAYATEICGRQFRTFCFSISLSGTRARLIRWDRAGAIATEAFDIKDKPELMCDFLWRFAHASDEERGLDHSLEPATADEEELFRKVITEHVKLQLQVDDEEPTDREVAAAVNDHYEAGRVTALDVYQNGKRHRYFTSRPVMSPLSMASRATRGYWAVDESGTIAFLKDTWRYDVKDMSQEGTILENLHLAGVRNIPKLGHHGDVPSNLFAVDTATSKDTGLPQCTQTQLFRLEPWVCTGGYENDGRRKITIIPHIHYRLTLGTVGYGLQSFRGTEELLHSTYHVYTAMRDATDKARVIHRDISLGNIILVKEPGSRIRRGYLIDWELACELVREGHARDYERTGTWQFMAVDLLANFKALHTFQEDMESLLWVVLYCSMRWGAHNLGPDDVPGHLQLIFDSFTEDTKGQAQGGAYKVMLIISRMHIRDYKFTSTALDKWIDTVIKFRADYHHDKAALVWKDPSHLDIFWARLLNDEVLERNDRTERQMDNNPREPPHHATMSSRSSFPGLDDRLAPVPNNASFLAQPAHSLEQAKLKGGRAEQTRLPMPVSSSKKRSARGRRSARNVTARPLEPSHGEGSEERMGSRMVLRSQTRAATTQQRAQAVPSRLPRLTTSSRR